MPFRIFRIRTLTGANVVGLLIGASLFSMFFFISLYMQQVLGYSAIKAGLSYLPLALSIIISAGIASQLVTRIGYKPVLAAGMVFIAAGLIWFSQVSVGGSYLGDILFPSLLAAVGLGFAFVTSTIAAVSGVEETRGGPRQRSDQHVAAGRRRARAGGAGVDRQLGDHRPGRVRQGRTSGDLTEGFQAAFLTGAGFAVLGLIATLVLIRSSDSRAHVEQEQAAGAAASAPADAWKRAPRRLEGRGGTCGSPRP